MKFSRYKLTVVAPLLIGLILTLVFGIVAVISIWSGNAIVQRSLTDTGRETLTVSSRLLFNPLFALDVTTMNRSGKHCLCCSTRCDGKGSC